MDRSSEEYYDRIAAELYTAVLADIMDGMGYMHQVMDPDIRPLYPEAKIVGRAATMLATDVYRAPAEPYKLEMKLLDELEPGEVVVCATHGPDGPARSALWGELLATHTRARGGRGAIIHGYSRDAVRLIGMSFPVFCVGLVPADSKGRTEAVAIREPIQIGGVLVRDGDLVVADYDGCVAVPQALEDEVIERAHEKVASENVVRDILREGASIQQVFAQYGVL